MTTPVAAYRGAGRPEAAFYVERLMDLVADELAMDPAEVRQRNFIPYERIIVQHGDTAITPMGQGTGGSHGLAIGGAAVVRATAGVRDKARGNAAHMLEAAPEDVGLDPEASRYDVRGGPARALTLARIADRAYSDDLPDDIGSGLEATDFFRPPDLLYPFGAPVAVVEIERETGVIHLREYVSVDDCGPRISPMRVAGPVYCALA